MKASKGQAITTAVFAVLKILIAVVVFVLIKVLIEAFLNIETSITEPGVFQWWIYGLPFMVPGILGVVAAATRHQAAYGVYMAACIIACIVDAVFCFLSFAFLFAMASVGGLNCEMVAGQCVCSSGLTVDTPTVMNGMNDCADLGKIVHMSYGVSAMMILGWMLCLAGSIISCVSCCCGKRDPGQVIVMGNYPGQVTVTSSTSSNAYAVGPQYAAAPPHYPGAQYVAPSAGSDNDEKNQYKYNRMY